MPQPGGWRDGSGPDAPELVYKICPSADWRRAERDGAFKGSPDDLRDGFIHLSTAAQLPGTLGRHFAGQSELVLVTVDARSLGPALVLEPSRGGALFPHLYGDLPVGAVRAVAPLRFGPDGEALDLPA